MTRLRQGDVVHTVRTSDWADIVEEDFKVLHVVSVTSGPKYFLHLAPVDAPNADFYGYVFHRWLEREA